MSTNFSAPISHEDVQEAYSAGDKAGYDRGYFEGYDKGKAGIRVNRFRRVMHYVVPVVALIAGVGIGSASHGSTPTNTVPTIPTQPTRAVPPAVTTPAPAVDIKGAALDKLLNAAHERASMSTMTKDQLKDVMDNAICKHLDDILSMSQAAHAKGVSSADAGALYGANSVIGYC